MTNDTLPHLLAAIQQSEDGDFLRLLAETTEAFLDGHVSAFAFFGGVPRFHLVR